MGGFLLCNTTTTFLFLFVFSFFLKHEHHTEKRILSGGAGPLAGWLIVATRRPNAARARFVSKPTSGTDENPRTNEGVGIVISVPPPVDRALPRLAHLHQRARSRRRSCRESKAAPAIQIRVAAAAAVAAPSLPHARGRRGARGWWAVQARLLTVVIIVVMLESMSRYYHHCMDLRIASSE